MPLRCALLFALPVDRAGFDRVAGMELLTDYRGLLFRTAATESVWTERYSRVAVAAQELIRTAKGLGVECVTDATLGDLARVSSGNDLVIVIGHWRGWAIADADWSAPASVVRARFDEAGLGVVMPRSGHLDHRELTRACNIVIEDGTLMNLVEPQLAAAVVNPILRLTLGRDILDQLLEGLLAPGNRIELADGLHTPSQFEAALHSAFRGVLDLATCSSIALATMIARRRGTAVRVVHTQALLDPLVCCLVLTETFRALSNCRGHGSQKDGELYLSIRLQIEAGLTEVKHQLRKGIPLS